MEHTDPLSISTMLDALQRLRIAPRETTNVENPAIHPPPPRFAPRRETTNVENPEIPPPPPGFAPRRETTNVKNPAIPPPPPGFATDITQENQPLIHQICRAALTPQEFEMRLQGMFNLMTNSSDGSLSEFKEDISKLNRIQLQRMTSTLTSDCNYFMDIVTNKYGSKRVQILLGKPDAVDMFLSAAILRCFIHLLTDKYASYVALRAIRVFDPETKRAMYEHTLYYALHLAIDQHGCIALNEIITDVDDTFYRNQLLDIVAHNALWLSYDDYGNFVIQHVLKLNDLRCTQNIAFALRDQCVELSLRKHGSYIVERLLEVDVSMMLVVMELLECKEDRLVRLARSDFGNFVVAKALRVTQQMISVDIFLALVQKLRPYLPLLRRSRGNNIAAFLDSFH